LVYLVIEVGDDGTCDSWMWMAISWDNRKQLGEKEEEVENKWYEFLLLIGVYVVVFELDTSNLSK